MNDTYLEDRRKAIAETDREILSLLKKRLDLATEIGRYKAEYGLDVVNPDVERRVIDRYRFLADENGLNPDRAEKICRLIMQESIEKESRFQRVSTTISSERYAETEEITDVEKRRKKILSIGIAAVAVLAILTVAAAMSDPDNASRIAFILAIPICLVALSFILGYADLPSSRNAKEAAWIEKRAYIFGGLMTAISLAVLVLFLMR